MIAHDAALATVTESSGERSGFMKKGLARLSPAALSAKHGAALGAILTLLSLTTLTIWVWTNASEDVMRIARERFEFRVSEVEFAIDQRLVAYEQVLRGGVGLFAASDEVTRQEWRTYVRILELDENYPGIRGVGYAERVLPNDRAVHESAIRAEGFPDYAIWPDGDRPEYTAIVYLEPFDWRNQRAFGYDMFSEPVRYDAMARARDTGLPAISGKVTLVQETDQGVQHGFLMYLPVLDEKLSTGDVDERRRALLGYVYAPFRMNDLMQGILGQGELPNVRLRIFDGAKASPDSLMYDSLGDPSETGEILSAFDIDRAFELDGRTWTLRFSSLPAFDTTIDLQKPRLILFGGLLISVLFAAVVWSMWLNRARVMELARANRGLKDEIEERLRLEADLKRSRDAAEAANEAKGEFLANVSHELRTPLTLILAPLEQILTGDGRPTDCRAQLERTQRNALLLLNRVNDILDFSKAEAGRFTVHWEHVDLVELLPTLVEDAAAIAESKGCSLSWHVDSALKSTSIDRRHFEKIVLNLLSNAVKFTPSGGSIRVEAKVLEEERFELAVTDNGIGIDEDKLPLLFQRFQQIDSSATRHYGGTGIGLALVKELAELMGGCVGVESQVGRGARFFVCLPLGADHVADTAAEGGGDPRPASGETDAALRRVRFQESGHVLQRDAGTEDRMPRQSESPRPRVLVADDNADMRSYVAELLSGECEILTASDGQQAWRLLESQPVDVVVSDVMMPELDGLGLAGRIKTSPLLSHVPVILLTARGGDEASVTGLSAGADDYILKPFSPPELRARVRAALRMAKVQADLRERTREAGVAMVVTGILHNLGNILSGVVVSATLIGNRLRQSKVTKLERLAALVNEHAGDLPEFLSQDSRGQLLPEFLGQLSEHLGAERSALIQEVDEIKACVDHAAGVVTTQKSLTKHSRNSWELLSADSLMETAYRLSFAAFEMHGIEIERNYADGAAVIGDSHKLLQILLNLFGNARHALRDAPQADKRLRIRTVLAGDQIRIEISDNGAGIDARHLPLLFNQGFTTKENGQGVGLHSSANWAREMGGTLTCHSDGLGCGATFVLTLPAPPVEPCAVVTESAVRSAAG